MEKVRRVETKSPQPYWSLENSATRGLQNQFTTENEALYELENVLSDAVSVRKISDVPLGGFLSGGIDSSLIVALMQKGSGRRFRPLPLAFQRNHLMNLDLPETLLIFWELGIMRC